MVQYNVTVLIPLLPVLIGYHGYLEHLVAIATATLKFQLEFKKIQSIDRYGSSEKQTAGASYRPCPCWPTSGHPWLHAFTAPNQRRHHISCVPYCFWAGLALSLLVLGWTNTFSNYALYQLWNAMKYLIYFYHKHAWNTKQIQICTLRFHGYHL